MEKIANWSANQTIIYGIPIQNWMFIAAGIFILWICYLVIM